MPEATGKAAIAFKRDRRFIAAEPKHYRTLWIWLNFNPDLLLPQFDSKPTQARHSISSPPAAKTLSCSSIRKQILRAALRRRVSSGMRIRSSGPTRSSLGISADTPSKQAKFKSKFNFPYPLLADVDHTVSEAYGVWKEKSMYGKKYFGIERTTFLIDKQGKIAKIFNKVKPAGHAEEVLQAL